MNDGMCERCRPWAATTMDLLIHRQEMSEEYPSVQPYPCDECGSTAWMLSPAMIPAEEFDNPPHLRATEERMSTNGVVAFGLFVLGLALLLGAALFYWIVNLE